MFPFTKREQEKSSKKSNEDELRTYFAKKNFLRLGDFGFKKNLYKWSRGQLIIGTYVLFSQSDSVVHPHSGSERF